MATTTQPLTLVAVRPLARKIAQRMAHREVEIDDLIQEGMIAFHREVERSRRLHIAIQRPRAHARTVMQRAMWGFYVRRKPHNDAILLLPLTGSRGSAQGFITFKVHNDIEGHQVTARLPSTGLGGEQVTAESGVQVDLFMGEYFDALQHAHGVTARLAAEDLVNCLDPNYRQWMVAEANRKRLRKQPQRRRASQVRRFSHGLIRQALGLSSQEWSHLLEEIRGFTRHWFAGDVTVPQ